MQKLKLFYTFFIALLLTTSFSAIATNSNWLDNQDVKQFINEMVKEHHFNAQDLRSQLAKANINQEVLTSIAKPAEKLPWYRYEPIFMTSKRIEEGVAFWQKNAVSLAAAEKKYGVPAEMIVAILGVETVYGKHTGKYNVFDALVTLAFHYPPRADFFRSELKTFLVLAREQHWDLATTRGSYAGAMGAPQFIASSYQKFAVDATNKGTRDLNNIEDAIASVANYFHLNGWKMGAPVVFAAETSGDKFLPLLAPTKAPKPLQSLEKWNEVGVQMLHLSAKKTEGKTDFALIQLDEAEGPTYWLGAHNFYVITRYNRSNLYAMAAYLLSQKVKGEYQKASATS